MHRSIVPLSLLVATAALWMLGIAGPATATSRSPRMVCPVQKASAAPPCCPLPAGADRGSADAQPACCQTTPCCASGTSPCCNTGASPCCTPTTCCASAGCCTTPPCGPGNLTIAASPNPSTAGRKVVISGGFAGSPPSGAQVVLWRELAGQSSFHQVAQTTTDSAGRYTFTLRRGAVMADQAWYVTSSGVQSATLQQHVDAVVGLISSTGSTTVGGTVALRGHVTPSHRGQVVLVEESRGGAWRVIARARLARGSTYAVSQRFSQPGVVELRVVLRGDARNDRSVSPTLTLTVK